MITSTSIIIIMVVGSCAVGVILYSNSVDTFGKILYGTASVWYVITPGFTVCIIGFFQRKMDVDTSDSCI